MEKNVVVDILEKIIGTDRVEFISGEILDVSTKDCKLSEYRGSVYGIAIEIKSDKDRKKIFNSIEQSQRRLTKENDWKEIANGYYPLYWGKDINMGIRLHSHTKSMNSTGTLQLNNAPKALKDHQIIYGAITCINYEKHEKELHDRYKDLMKTTKSKNLDELKMEDINLDEQ